MSTEEDVWDLSDEELEAAFKEAKREGVTVPEEVDEDEVDVVDDEVIEVDDNQEEDEDEEVEELEQLDDEQDSDDDTGSDDVDDDETDEDSEEDEDNSDENSEDSDENTDDVAEEDTKDEQTTDKALEDFFAQTSTVRANGVEHEFTNKEKLEMFDKMFPQATDYTKKMQAIKPHRKTIDALEQAGVGYEDVNLMIDVLKGDKDAIANVLKRTGVDALDLDTENSVYKPNDYGRDETTLEIKDVVDRLSSDPDFSRTQRVLSKDWDEASFNELAKDPKNIELLHIDIKTGVFDKVNAVADKLKVLDGGTKTDLEYYGQAARELAMKEAEAQRRAQEQERVNKAAEEAKKVEEVKARRAKQTNTKKASRKRKAAAVTRKNAGTKQVNYLDGSDEDFEEWYNKLQASH